ncbi:MAG: hypothetical protein ACK41F_03135, partial [Fimbriimonadaceae bacterium]
RSGPSGRARSLVDRVPVRVLERLEHGLAEPKATELLKGRIVGLAAAPAPLWIACPCASSNASSIASQSRRRPSS